MGRVQAELVTPLPVREREGVSQPNAACLGPELRLDHERARQIAARPTSNRPIGVMTSGRRPEWLDTVRAGN